MSPVIDELAEDWAGRVAVFKVDLDAAQATADPDDPVLELSIRSIPTFLLYNEGILVDTKVGGGSKQAMKDWVEKTLWPAPPEPSSGGPDFTP